MTPLWFVWLHPSLSSVFWSVVCMYRDVVAAGAAYADRVDATSDETVREPAKNATTRPTTRVSADFLIQPTSLANHVPALSPADTPPCHSGLSRAPRLRSGTRIVCTHELRVQVTVRDCGQSSGVNGHRRAPFAEFVRECGQPPRCALHLPDELA